MKTLARRSRLSTLPLMMATFFMVSGGPFGLEELIARAGYNRAMLALALTPLLWSIPTALMVAELSTAMPQDGGFYVWVTRALGPFWGFQEAWLSLVASVFDMAIYPTLFVLYLARIWPRAGDGANAIVIGAAMIVACVLWNLRGAGSVGRGSEWLGLLLLAPFAVVSVLAFRHTGVIARPAAPMDLAGGIMVAMWNLMGWDNAATVAGEVEDPQRSYPRMLFGATLLIVACYLIPVAAVRFAGVPLGAWQGTGAWADVAGAIAGRWAELAVVAGGMICGIGMFNSLTLSYSRLPYAMACDGMLPRIFARVTANGVPWVSVLACSAAWMLSLGLSFTRLIMLDILLYGLSLVLEFVALVVLRLRQPGMARPYKIPGGALTCALLALPPTALVILGIVRNRAEHLGRMSALLFGLLLVGAGFGIYAIMRAVRKPGAKAAAQS